MKDVLALILIVAITLFVAYQLVVFLSKDFSYRKHFLRKVHDRHEKIRKEENNTYNEMVIKYKIKQFLTNQILPIVIALTAVIFLSGIISGTRNKTAQISSIGKITTVNESQQIRKIENNQISAPRETPVIIEGNTIIIPVTIGNSGTVLETRLVLDTGCSGMLLHDDVARSINLKITNTGKTTIANGEQIDSYFGSVDFVKVGGLTEERIQVSTYPIHNKEKHTYGGLLGMGFLKKHPFQIDYKRSVVRWL